MARRTGVPAATLRKWEERYGVPAPSRTDGAQRRYGERDLRQIEWLRDRLAEGLRIGEAVELLKRIHEPVDGAADLVDAVVEALAARSASRVEALVHQAFAVLDPETAILEVAVPALERTGDLWEQGEISVADEHFVAQLLATKLRTLVDSTASGAGGVAVLACVPGERHELGLLSLAVLLQADGWRVLYLGQDTPLADAFALASESEACLVGVSGTMDGPAVEARDELERLEGRYPAIRVERGGSAFDGPPAERAVKSLRRLRRRVARGAAAGPR